MTVILPAVGDNNWGTTLNTAVSGVDTRVTSLESTIVLKSPLISPSFTTPSLGVATATSINKVTLTAPATSSTLTIADGKVLTVNNTITLSSSTDGNSLNIGTGGTLGTGAFATAPILTSGIGTTGGYAATTNYPLFPAANDTLSLAVGTYKIELSMQLDVVGSTTTAALYFSPRGAGTAVGTLTFTSLGTTTQYGTTTQIYTSLIAASGVAQVTNSATGNPRNYLVRGTGILRITTAGTIIPSYQFSATLTGASSSTLYADNYLLITPLSTSATAASTGSWS